MSVHGGCEILEWTSWHITAPGNRAKSKDHRCQLCSIVRREKTLFLNTRVRAEISFIFSSTTVTDNNELGRRVKISFRLPRRVFIFVVKNKGYNIYSYESDIHTDFRKQNSVRLFRTTAIVFWAKFDITHSIIQYYNIWRSYSVLLVIASMYSNFCRLILKPVDK